MHNSYTKLILLNGPEAGGIVTSPIEENNVLSHACREESNSSFLFSHHCIIKYVPKGSESVKLIYPHYFTLSSGGVSRPEVSSCVFMQGDAFLDLLFCTEASL